METDRSEWKEGLTLKQYLKTFRIVSRETMTGNSDKFGENHRFGFPERYFVRKVLPGTASDSCFCRVECRKKGPQCTAAGKSPDFFGVGKTV